MYRNKSLTRTFSLPKMPAIVCSDQARKLTLSQMALKSQDLRSLESCLKSPMGQPNMLMRVKYTL